MDENYALVYDCFDTTDENGRCLEEPHIEALGRQVAPIPQEDRDQLAKLIKSTCYEPGDLESVVHDSKNCFVILHNTSLKGYISK